MKMWLIFINTFYGTQLLKQAFAWKTLLVFLANHLKVLYVQVLLSFFKKLCYLKRSALKGRIDGRGILWIFNLIQNIDELNMHMNNNSKYCTVK